MFTGLVLGTGRIAAATRRGGDLRLLVAPGFRLAEVKLGESIAVNGVCLTVERFSAGPTGAATDFEVFASAETLSKSNIGSLSAGSAVNLERALALGDRLGGHLVSGHVDCLATVDSRTEVGGSTRFVLKFPAEFGKFVVEKGSVGLDGVSLTVNDCGEDWLSVNIIPTTIAETTIVSWRPGSRVNMEADLIGKYVARMLGGYAAKTGGGLTEDALKRAGFL